MKSLGELTHNLNSASEKPLKTEAITAGHWLHQMLKLFPDTGNLTEEMIKAMVLVFTQYPESMLKEIVNPLTGLPSRFKFTPSIMEFGQACAEIASSVALHDQRLRDHEEWVRQKALPAPEKAPERPCYEGPIENVKPGDILSWDRQEEYRLYMQKAHQITPKIWGFYEEYRDNGQRPFAVRVEAPKEKNQIPLPPENPNPFE